MGKNEADFACKNWKHESTEVRKEAMAPSTILGNKIPAKD